VSTVEEARKWASNSLPRLIVFAIGLHLVFSALLMTQLQELRRSFLRQEDEVGDKEAGNMIDDSGRSLQASLSSEATLDAPIRRTMKLSQLLPGIGLTAEDTPLEADELYVQHVVDMNDKIKRTLNVAHSLSCRWRSNVYHAIYEEDCEQHAASSYNNNHANHINPEMSKRVVLFNPMDQERILCDGRRIPSTGILVLPAGQMDLDCSEPPRLYEQVPSLDTKEYLDPIELRFSPRYTKLYDQPCDVPCRTDHDGNLLAQRHVTGTPFWLLHSMEGPQYYKALEYDPIAHRYNRFFSTTSFKSEVPLAYFSFEEYGDSLQSEPAVDYDTAIKGAVFMARNCRSLNNREGLVKSLIDSDFRVDSVSECLKNAEKPPGGDNKKAIARHYLFYLAFENQCENDYITEKLWETLQAGVVPVYYGAPNVEEHVPPNSIINANAFETSQDLAQYLIKVANDKALYESYHAWRSKPLPSSFVNKYKFTEVHSTCRTCRWAFSKKYGLGFNHTLQTVEKGRISRDSCHDNNLILTHPFQETWFSGDASDVLVTTDGNRSMTCFSRGAHFDRAIQVGGKSLTRTVRSQDGVTDIMLEQGAKSTFAHSESVILQMKTPILGDAKTHSLISLSKNNHRFQDLTSRYTILTSRRLLISSPGKGVLTLRISNLNVPIQIRIIIEDIDTHYDDMANRTNFFGKTMTEEFLNPLEKFVVFGSPKKDDDWTGLQVLDAGIISTSETEDEKEDEEAIRKEQEEIRAAKHAEAEKVRFKLIKVHDDIKEEKDTLAKQGIKKLIELGIIRVTTSDDEATTT